MNALLNEDVSTEIIKTYDALKAVSFLALEANAVIPTFNATLDYVKMAGAEELPTSLSFVLRASSVNYKCLFFK
jgi:hypothetical protein